MQSFVIVAHLIRSLAQFDWMFEVKLATHCLLAASNQSAAPRQLLMSYANMFYAVGSTSGSAASKAMSQGENSLTFLPLRRLLNESVLGRLVQSCQLRFLNYFMVAVVQDLMPAFATDNDQFLTTFVTYCSPQSLHKLTMSIKLGQIKLFSEAGGLANSGLFSKHKQSRRGLPSGGQQNQETALPVSYMSQQALWTLLVASLEQPESTLISRSSRAPSEIQHCPIEILGRFITDQIQTLVIQQKTNATQLQQILSATFLGLNQFVSTYNSLIRTAGLTVPATAEKILKGFHSMLELYHGID